MNGTETNQNQQSIQILLPKCLELIGNEAKSAELRVVYDAPTDQSTYQYSIVWEDNSPGAEEKYRVAITEANKIMLAVKAKKMNKVIVKKNEKKVGSRKTLEDEMIEKEEQGIHFPPDLRSRSEQREKEPESTTSIPTSASTTLSTGNSTSEVERSTKSKKKSRTSTRSSVKTRQLKTDDHQLVCVKVFIIDREHFRGKLRPISIMESNISRQIKAVLLDVVREHFHGVPSEKLIRSGSVLFAFHDKNNVQKVRRIRQSDVDKLSMSNLAKYRGDIVLILDLVGFITKGKKIPLQVDIDQD